MLRPQGLFQNPQPKPFDWQQTYAAPAGGGPTAAPDTWAGDLGQSTLPHGTPAAPAGYQQAPTAYQQGNGYPPAPGYAPAAQYAQGSQYPGGAQYPPEALAQTSVQAPALGQQAGGYPASGAFPPPGAYPGQYPAGQGPPGQYGAGQYGQGQFPPPPFPPGAAYGQDQSSLGGPGTGLRGRLLKRPIVPIAVAGAAVIVVVGALILSSQGGSSPSNAGGPGTGAGGPSASTSPSSSPGAAQLQAATALNLLLQQSGTYRAQVSPAYDNVLGCGKDRGKDVQVFTKSAANRDTLLAKLKALPGRQTLSASMITDLTAAWQASVADDTDLAKWARDAVGHCHKGNQNDPNLAAAGPYDSKATNAKTAFVAEWNQLAKKDNLPTYAESDI